MLAISPLVDPADTIRRVGAAEDTCGITRALELTPGTKAIVTAATAGTATAAIVGHASLSNTSVDPLALTITTAGTAAVTYAVACFIDWRWDGSRKPCLQPIAHLYRSLLAERWTALGTAFGLAGPPSLADYPRRRSGVSLEALAAAARDLPGRVGKAADGKRARLVIVSADDDPVVSPGTIARFEDIDSDRVAVIRTRRGGHRVRRAQPRLRATFHARVLLLGASGLWAAADARVRAVDQRTVIRLRRALASERCDDAAACAGPRTTKPD